MVALNLNQNFEKCDIIITLIRPIMVDTSNIIGLKYSITKVVPLPQCFYNNNMSLHYIRHPEGKSYVIYL